MAVDSDREAQRPVEVEPAGDRPPLFAGVPVEVVDELLGRLERRSFTAGTTILSEGDLLADLYIAATGAAEVLVADRHGVEHRIGRIEPGTTVGEISLFTDEPATATIRATADCELIVLPRDEFARFADEHPVVYRNLGTTLAKRLARASRRAVHTETSRLVVLHDRGAPPLLAAALAASVAWHTRTPTLLLVLDDAPEELRALARDRRAAGRPTAGIRSDVLLGDGSPAYEGEALRGTLEDLFLQYEHVLVLTRSEIVPLVTAREIELRGEVGPPATGRLTVAGWCRAGSRLGPDANGIVSVPAPDDETRADLAAGLLPLRGATGRVLGWVARDLTDLKVGLALGAGSMRGYAHVGVLQALERAGIVVDYVAGTSVGAAVAGLFALGRTPGQIADTLDGCGAKMFRPTIPLASLLSSRPMTTFIRSVGEGRRLEDLDLPCAIVTADIVTGREVVLRRGDLALAVVASISIPGIYPVQRLSAHALVDGGVINPVPASVAAEMGAGQVIAVKLGAPSAGPLDAAAEESAGGRPFIVPVLMRAIEMMQERIATETTAPTVLVTPTFPNLPDARLRRFREGRRYVESGAEAAEAALPRLAAMLPWIRG